MASHCSAISIYLTLSENESLSVLKDAFLKEFKKSEVWFVKLIPNNLIQSTYWIEYHPCIISSQRSPSPLVHKMPSPLSCSGMKLQQFSPLPYTTVGHWHSYTSAVYSLLKQNKFKIFPDPISAFRFHLTFLFPLEQNSSKDESRLTIFFSFRKSAFCTL